MLKAATIDPVVGKVEATSGRLCHELFSLMEGYIQGLTACMKGSTSGDKIASQSTCSRFIHLLKSQTRKKKRFHNLLRKQSSRLEANLLAFRNGRSDLHARSEEHAQQCNVADCSSAPSKRHKIVPGKRGSPSRGLINIYSDGISHVLYIGH